MSYDPLVDRPSQDTRIAVVIRKCVWSGIAAHTGHIGSLLKAADEALYAGKAAGRNRVALAEGRFIPAGIPEPAAG